MCETWKNPKQISRFRLICLAEFHFVSFLKTKWWKMGCKPLHSRLIRPAYAYLVAAPTTAQLPPSLRYKQQIPFTHQISLKRDKLHCYRKTCSHQRNERRGSRPRIHPRKLIIHRKWNEHTRGFSTSDRWSNLKEFMSARERVHERTQSRTYILARPGGSKGCWRGLKTSFCFKSAGLVCAYQMNTKPGAPVQFRPQPLTTWPPTCGP